MTLTSKTLGFLILFTAASMAFPAPIASSTTSSVATNSATVISKETAKAATAATPLPSEEVHTANSSEKDEVKKDEVKAEGKESYKIKK